MHCLMTALMLISEVSISFAANTSDTQNVSDTQKEQTTSQASVQKIGQKTGQKTGQKSDNTSVLGQTAPQGQKQDSTQKKEQDAQALFEESLRQMMPLTEGQIQEYR